MLQLLEILNMQQTDSLLFYYLLYLLNSAFYFLLVIILCNNACQNDLTFSCRIPIAKHSHLRWQLHHDCFHKGSKIDCIFELHIISNAGENAFGEFVSFAEGQPNVEFVA